MLMEPENAAEVSTVASSCGNCGLEERRLLHHVRHRGTFRRLCTNCVLRLHAQSFCPSCFQVHPPTPSNDSVINCFKCYSSSHSNCVAAGPGSPSSPYVCPLCTNPNAPIFKLKRAKEGSFEVSQGSEECRVIDADAAKKLLAAAKIASAVMNKAVVLAKAEKEKRAKEAAFARKRAKEALEHVAYLGMREKLRKKETSLTAPDGMSLPVVGYFGGGDGGFAGAIVKRENGNMRNFVDSLVVTGEKIRDTREDADKLETSNEVLAALNWIDLKENENMDGITRQGADSGGNDDDVLMDVDEMARTGEVSEEDDGAWFTASDIDMILELGGECDEEDDCMQGAKQEEVDNGVVLVPPVVDSIEFSENTNGR